MSRYVPMGAIRRESGSTASILGLSVIPANDNSVSRVVKRDSKNSSRILRSHGQRVDVSASVRGEISARRGDQFQRRQLKPVQPSSAGAEPHLMIGSRPRRGVRILQRNDGQRLVARSKSALFRLHGAQTRTDLSRPLSTAVIGHKQGESSLYRISQDCSEARSVELQAIPET